MKKIFSTVLMLALVLTTFVLVGCGSGGGEDKPANLLSEKNVNDVLNDLRGSEDEGGYKIDGVEYGQNDGGHFCSASFDKAKRGTIGFIVTGKGSVIAANILITDPTDFNLNVQANYVLVKFLTSIGMTRPEMEGFNKDYSAYLTAEAENQGTVAPTIDKVFTIQSSKLKKAVAIAIKGDDKQRTYSVTVAQ